MLKILLAEDNKVDEIALTEYLKNNLGDFEISSVPTCKALIEKLDMPDTYDIIILDHILEDEQSLKYISKIKEKSKSAEIIVLSGQSDISVCIQYLNSGVYAYLNKEHNAFQNLLKNINEIITKGQSKTPFFQKNKVIIYIAAVVIALIISLIYFFKGV
jgi:DNA-binding NtrC family response regulator